MHSRRNRLERLERLIASQTCPACSDVPVRIIATNPETGHAWYSETMPESGCPECGKQPIVIDVQSTPPVDLARL